MAADGVSSETTVALSNLPATPRQRRLILVVAILLFATFAITAPFVAVMLPQVRPFIPTVEGIIFVNDLITSILLFSQFTIVRSRGLLALASGYLYSALIIIPHVLSYPGVFAESGVLGGGTQTTAYLYIFWHVGSAAAILAYACLKDEYRPAVAGDRSSSVAISRSVAVVVVVVCALVWVTTFGERFLPALFADAKYYNYVPVTYLFSNRMLAFYLITLAVVWMRRSSLLDYWLALVLCAMISEQMLVAVLSSERFTLGYYAGRLFSLATSIFVIGLLLSEMTRLYSRLARSNLLLQRERGNKLMSLQAAVASISHEIKQPLTAIALNGAAARRFLQFAPPKLDAARSALDNLVSDSHRTGQILDNLRQLFGKGEQEKETVDVNDVALAALRLLRADLTDHGIEPDVDLASGLPSVMGHRIQLQEVILNLAHNAIEAMTSVRSGRRTLAVRTRPDGGRAILIEVEDSGPGIDPERLERIFDPFVTTKLHGMGLGLAICSAIVDQHGGKLTASSDGESGARFQVHLPIQPAGWQING